MNSPRGEFSWAGGSLAGASLARCSGPVLWQPGSRRLGLRARSGRREPASRRQAQSHIHATGSARGHGVVRRPSSM